MALLFTATSSAVAGIVVVGAIMFFGRMIDAHENTLCLGSILKVNDTL
jgi:type IV secretory pathway VirB2 component (pilin)